jgi:allophanate hydrolase
MFNNLVGIKPTPGLFPNSGEIPACRSANVEAVFTGSVADGMAVRRVMEGVDRADPFSCPAVPANLPTSPTTPKVANMQADLIAKNSQFGR